MRAVKRAQAAMQAAADAGDVLGVRRAQGWMFAAAMRLRRDGRVASPDALCRALGVPRRAYDEAVRRRRAGERPPLELQASRVWTALEWAGDVRFLGRAA